MGFKLPCIVSSLKSLDVDHHSIINAFSELIQDYVNSELGLRLRGKLKIENTGDPRNVYTPMYILTFSKENMYNS